MTARQAPSAKLKLVAEGALIMTNDERITRTLIQRGESDSYIREKLQSLGYKSEEAQHLIHETRVHHETSSAYLASRYDMLLFLIGCAALGLLLLWFFLNGMLS
jgi:hypothetical protein